MEHSIATTADWRHVGQLTIDSFPDLVLLEISAVCGSSSKGFP